MLGTESVQCAEGDVAGGPKASGLYRKGAEGRWRDGQDGLQKASLPLNACVLAALAFWRPSSWSGHRIRHHRLPRSSLAYTGLKPGEKPSDNWKRTAPAACASAVVPARHCAQAVSHAAMEGACGGDASVRGALTPVCSTSGPGRGLHILGIQADLCPNCAESGRHRANLVDSVSTLSEVEREPVNFRQIRAKRIPNLGQI